jgi:hypothetical protein
MGTIVGLSMFLATSIDGFFNKSFRRFNLCLAVMTLPLLILLATLWAVTILIEGGIAIYKFIKQVVVAYKNA